MPLISGLLYGACLTHGPPASEMAFHVELWGCGGYITSVQWVQDGSNVNQSPGTTVPWSDSTQNFSVNGYLAALRKGALTCGR
jgi:hypothetical protein